MLFKYAVEMVGVLEARNLGDLIDLEIRVEKQRAAYVEFYLAQYLGEGKSGGTSDQLADVRHGIVKMLC